LNSHSADAGSAPCAVSIVIKALNEERRIEAAVESSLRALAAIAPLRGEVVLADSCSSDRTVELASNYPIRIVQLAHAADRCCGVGPQLGFQHARGEFVYILDGDMQLLEGFLPAALALLKDQPDVAGVAGQVVETNTTSLEYIGRMERAERHMRPGLADRLEMGGLYRRKAIEETGYFSDRNLHSYEELDLAARLRVRGWKLWRLDTQAVLHEGHDAPALELLLRRWRSGYICGIGELVRSAWGQPHWRLVLQGASEVKLYAGVIGWWLLLLTVPLWPLAADARALAFLALLAAPFLGMAWRKRSLKKAAFAIASWSFHAAGLVRGLLFSRRSPEEPVPSHMLRDAPLKEAHA